MIKLNIGKREVDERSLPSLSQEWSIL